MALATWWQGDPLPELTPISNFRVELVTDIDLMAAINRLTHDEVSRRYADQHRSYVGFMADVPVAYGWVAVESASIGELSINMRLSDQDHYLWDFATLPDWQGYGLYPRLLQGILRHTTMTASRYWILYAPENLPSGAGIEKAGFATIGQLSFGSNYELGLIPLDTEERVMAGASLLGISIVSDDLAPCWCCQTPNGDEQNAACWPPISSDYISCTCSIQRRPSASLPADILT